LDMSLESGQSLPACVITSPCYTETANNSTPKAWQHRKFGTGPQGQWVHTRKEPQIYYHQRIAHCTPLSGSRIQQTGHNYVTTIVYTCLLSTAVFYTISQRWYIFFR
jgi:hypothetical protein